MIGDKQLPLDSEWKDWETLDGQPVWFREGKPSPAGRYTFTSGRLGPVTIQRLQKASKEGFEQ